MAEGHRAYLGRVGGAERVAKHAALKGSPWDTTVNLMNYFRGLMDACLAAVRSHLFRDEEVLAMGSCADITTTGEPKRSRGPG
jgi:hypothetical protein